MQFLIDSNFDTSIKLLGNQLLTTDVHISKVMSFPQFENV